MPSNTPSRSWQERALHALAFELIATLICAPVLGWVMDTSLAKMGALTVAISLVAMAWNMVFNTVFDRVQRRIGFTKTPPVRVVHTLLFEIGLAVMTVPLAAWWLGIGLWEAFLLDAGILLFFVPYTLIFNWGYDVLRERWLKQQAPNETDYL
jgi:uncharacterized membrane protein